MCLDCHKSFPELEPRFSFNSPLSVRVHNVPDWVLSIIGLGKKGMMNIGKQNTQIFLKNMQSA